MSHRSSLQLPSEHDECLPLSQSERVICSSARTTASADSCTNVPARVELAFFGESLEPEISRPDYAFWKAGALEAPDAPSAAEVARRKQRLYCGEPGWSALRSALERWCDGEAAALNAKGVPISEDDARKHAVYCSRHEPYSLLYQATRCTNLSASCPASKYQLTPSVDRAELERCEWIDLSYMGFGGIRGELLEKSWCCAAMEDVEPSLAEGQSLRSTRQAGKRSKAHGARCDEAPRSRKARSAWPFTSGSRPGAGRELSGKGDALMIATACSDGSHGQ
jgi:hypothetical protein